MPLRIESAYFSQSEHLDRTVLESVVYSCEASKLEDGCGDNSGGDDGVNDDGVGDSDNGNNDESDSTVLGLGWRFWRIVRRFG